MFIAEMVLFGIFTAILALSPSYGIAVAALVGTGVALGCDYPTAHLMISESIPSPIRGRMVLAAFGFQAVGGLVGTAVGFLILFENPDLGAWRWMYASTLVLALPVLIGRFFIVQSPLWLMFRGRVEEAQAATERLLRRDPPYPKEVILQHPEAGRSHRADKAPWSRLFHGTNLRRTIFGLGTLVSAGPWHLRHRDLHAHHPGDTHRRARRSSAQYRRTRPKRDSGQQGGDIHRHLADCGNRLCRAAGGSRRPHPSSDPRLHRLRRWPADCGAVASRRRNAIRRAALCGLHAVQLHDQYRAKRDDLPDRGGGVPDFDSRHGSWIRGILRQDWRSVDRVSVSNPAQGHRHRSSAADSGRHQPRG